jgi:hypothetical protein
MKYYYPNSDPSLPPDKVLFRPIELQQLLIAPGNNLWFLDQPRADTLLRLADALLQRSTPPPGDRANDEARNPRYRDETGAGISQSHSIGEATARNVFKGIAWLVSCNVPLGMDSINGLPYYEDPQE